MSSSILFWGFQDFSLVSDLARKSRNVLSIREFYIQINDIEKTMTLMDVHPEEIIRTKYDLNNLYQWLLRCTKKNCIVMIDLFTLMMSDNLDENYLSLKKILELDFMIFFVAPKMLHPQSIQFLNDNNLNSIYQKTNEFTKILNSFYEIIVNSRSNSSIFAIPIPDTIFIHRHNYALFETKVKYHLTFRPKILKKFSVSYIDQYVLFKDYK
jgi:hypothetical protein